MTKAEARIVQKRAERVAGWNACIEERGEDWWSYMAHTDGLWVVTLWAERRNGTGFVIGRHKVTIERYEDYPGKLIAEALL